MEKYNALKNRHADFLSLDELSRVCKIAKKSARYLVEHGVIPAIDTGKQTWRYKISIDDVITYLKRREQVGSMIPRGMVSSRPKIRKKGVMGNRKSFSQLVAPGQESEVAQYFEYIYADCDEILTTYDLAEMTGLNQSTVTKLLKAGKIKSLEGRPKYLVPKQYLLEFVITQRFIDAKTKSETFMKILGGFEIWKTARS